MLHLFQFPAMLVHNVVGASALDSHPLLVLIVLPVTFLYFKLNGGRSGSNPKQELGNVNGLGAEMENGTCPDNSQTC